MLQRIIVLSPRPVVLRSSLGARLAPRRPSAPAAQAARFRTSSSSPPAARSPARRERRAGRLHVAARSASSSSSPPCRRRRSSPTCEGEQISNIGSQDMNDEVWLKLATPHQRARRDAGRGRHRHHARHRHDRGDRVLPEPGRQVEEAGRADRGDASLDGALGRRPAQLLQRRGGGGEQGRGRAAACSWSSTTGSTARPRSPRPARPPCRRSSRRSAA